ncbi:MAG TPA: hypothetical protein VFX05_03625 [Casimicrobiaceae bacterium]|nr:hypothetical protein [Casimicrobiaceae bacterium]
MDAMQERSDEEPARAVSGIIQRVIADVPVPRARAEQHPDAAASRIAREAAKRAALVSGSLALPAGPLGLLTVLPDLYIIWKTQRQMVADIFAVYGRTAELSRTHMLYCLFRHAASHVLRDVAVRSGERFVVQQLGSRTLTSLAGKVGTAVTRRVAGSTATRWIPIAGAVAVSAYAYWDTLQVAKTAQKLLAQPPRPESRGQSLGAALRD